MFTSGEYLNETEVKKVGKLLEDQWTKCEERETCWTYEHTMLYNLQRENRYDQNFQWQKRLEGKLDKFEQWLILYITGVANAQHRYSAINLVGTQ